MLARSLDELVEARLLQRQKVARRRVAGLMRKARRDLAFARDVAAAVYEERAMAVAYEAALGACIGLLALAGYRLSGQPGHHRAALEGTAAILGAERLPLVTRLDRARAFRNAFLYEGEAPPPATGELDQLLRDAEELLHELEGRLP